MKEEEKIKLRIRKAKQREFKEIAKIYKNGFNEKPFNENWSFNESFRKIKVFSKYCDIWIAVLDKKIVGFLIINPYQWKIGEIAFGEEMVVKKEFRRKDIGTMLFRFIFDYYSRRGYKKFMGIINKDANSFGFIKKLNLNVNKNDLLIEKKLK